MRSAGPVDSLPATDGGAEQKQPTTGRPQALPLPLPQQAVLPSVAPQQPAAQPLRWHVNRLLPSALDADAPAVENSMFQVPEKAASKQDAPTTMSRHSNVSRMEKPVPAGSGRQSVLPPLQAPLTWHSDDTRERRAAPLLHTAARAAERASKMQWAAALGGNSWHQQQQAWQQQQSLAAVGAAAPACLACLAAAAMVVAPTTTLATFSATATRGPLTFIHIAVCN